jgi:uncharacterized UBP type Zn finger protein
VQAKLSVALQLLCHTHYDMHVDHQLTLIVHNMALRTNRILSPRYVQPCMYHCSQLESLQSMGFSEAASAKALIDKGGNVDRALSHLFDTAAAVSDDADDSDSDSSATASSGSLLTKKHAAASAGSASAATSDSWGAAPSNFDAYGNPVVYNNHAPVMDSW